MDKASYAQLEKAAPGEEGAQPAQQRPQHGLRRKVSRAFSSWTSRSGDRKEGSTDNVSPPPTPPLPPAATTIASRTRVGSRNELQRVPVPHTLTYPLVRMDPVLIGCFVCL
ncbi:hypothetical protein OH77DRAFT_1426917 [Trametes cingulata]|nr:hypothetical protein OH77DRAFT_1426917 [Trametes cingulata]